MHHTHTQATNIFFASTEPRWEVCECVCVCFPTLDLVFCIEFVVCLVFIHLRTHAPRLAILDFCFTTNLQTTSDLMYVCLITNEKEKHLDRFIQVAWICAFNLVHEIRCMWIAIEIAITLCLFVDYFFFFFCLWIFISLSFSSFKSAIIVYQTAIDPMAFQFVFMITIVDLVERNKSTTATSCGEKTRSTYFTSDI